MAFEFEIPVQKWSGRIREITLGATVESGGTRTSTITIGGENSLPALDFEGEFPHRPALFMEVLDDPGPNYPQIVKNEFGNAINDPVQWAKKCVEDFGAQGICLKFKGTNPEGVGRSVDAAVETFKNVLAAVGVPLIIYGSGHYETDTKLMEAISNAGKGERLVLGAAEPDWYKSLAVAAMANNHLVIGFSNIDINLAKQIVILLKDFGLPVENIIQDPLQAGLGVGLEYSYSIIERIKLAALGGDSFLQLPIYCDLSLSWDAPDVTDDNERLGDRTNRAIEWEVTTGISALTAGADLLIVRSPTSLKRLKGAIEGLYPTSGAGGGA